MIKGSIIKKLYVIIVICTLFVTNAVAKEFVVDTLKDFKSAYKKARPGDKILLDKGTDKVKYKGREIEGVYKLYNIDLDCKGTTERPIIIKPHDGAKVIFLGNGKDTIFNDFLITGSWIVLEGIEITRSANGIRLTSTQTKDKDKKTAHNVLIKNVEVYYNIYTGVILEDLAYDNTILDCDSHHHTKPEQADGFGGGDRGFRGSNHAEGPGNKFINCRAWKNADDGFDFFRSVYPIELVGCISYKNGKGKDGSGFKLGGEISSKKGKAAHVVEHCIACKNNYYGFTDNKNGSAIVLKNNSAYDNGDANFRFITGKKYVLKNNISVLPGRTSDEKRLYTHKYDTNSWEEIYPSDEDIKYEFVSLDFDEVIKKRDKDGKLPKSDFLRPKNNSILKKMGAVGKSIIIEDADDEEISDKWWSFDGNMPRYSREADGSVFFEKFDYYVLGSLEDDSNSLGDTTHKIVRWDMLINTDKDTLITIAVQTDKGSRLLEYGKDSSNTKERYTLDGKVHLYLGIGRDIKDKAWHKFSRDIQKDLRRFDEEIVLEKITGFIFEGAKVYLDNIAFNNSK